MAGHGGLANLTKFIHSYILVLATRTCARLEAGLWVPKELRAYGRKSHEEKVLTIHENRAWSGNGRALQGAKRKTLPTGVQFSLNPMTTGPTDANGRRKSAGVFPRASGLRFSATTNPCSSYQCASAGTQRLRHQSWSPRILMISLHDQPSPAT